MGLLDLPRNWASLTVILALSTFAPAWAREARAETAPGGPPWSCQVAAACDAEGCIPLPGMLTHLVLEAGAAEATLRLDGRTVGHYATEAEALEAVTTGAIPSDASLVLVRDAEDPGDALGFSAFAPSSTGGVLGLSDHFASLICAGG